MKVITANLPSDLDSIEIHPLADLHIGDKCCLFKDIQQELDYIKNTPNAYCLLDGDLMDTAISNSVGDTYAQDLTPSEQIKHCVAIFGPIKNKILAVCGGNHENRIYKQDGIDITALMCDELGISDKYSSTAALLYIRFGKEAKTSGGRKVRYSLYMLHGNGNGRKEGGKLQRLADLCEIIDADIYVAAHVHQPAGFRNKFYRCDPKNNGVMKVEHLFVNTAAWLEYGGYSEKMALKPGSGINPVIMLDGHRHMARVLV